MNNNKLKVSNQDLSAAITATTIDTTPSTIIVTVNKGATSVSLEIKVRLQVPTNSFIYTNRLDRYNFDIITDVNGDLLPNSLTDAIAYLHIFKNSVEDTANWTITRTDSTGVTSTIVGNQITITGLTVDNAFIALSATKSGAPTQVQTIIVNKVSGGEVPGLKFAFGQQFGSFSTNTFNSIYIKLAANGDFLVRQGNTGAYTKINAWHSPPNSGALYWVNMQYTPGAMGGTLSGGTNGVVSPNGDFSTWYNMNIDREWYLEVPASPAGEHSVNIQCYMASGPNAEEPSTINTTSLIVRN